MLNEKNSPTLSLKQKHIDESQQSIQAILDQLKNFDSLKEDLQKLLDQLKNLSSIEESIYKLLDQVKNLGSLKEGLSKLKEEALLIKQSYQLALKHFPRIQGTKGLQQCDVDELEKWIKRCKTPEHLKKIVVALNELERYNKFTIHTNLYALVQRIIIEGPRKIKQ